MRERGCRGTAVCILSTLRVFVVYALYPSLLSCIVLSIGLLFRKPNEPGAMIGVSCVFINAQPALAKSFCNHLMRYWLHAFLSLKL